MRSSILEALQRERRGLEATPTDKEVKERLNRLKGKNLLPPFYTTSPYIMGGGGDNWLITGISMASVADQVWIRIRGSIPLTNGSGCGSGSFYFHH
jgi:hypothetical protein